MFHRPSSDENYNSAMLLQEERNRKTTTGKQTLLCCQNVWTTAAHSTHSLSLRIVPVALSALEAKDVERYGARRQTVITNDVHRHVLVLVGHRCILNLGIQPIIVTLNLVALIQTLAAQRARHGTLPVQLTQTLAMDGMTAVW